MPAALVLVDVRRRLELSCDVSRSTGNEPGSVVGPDDGSVIGRHAQTLDAVEHVLGRIVFGDYVRTAKVTTDVEAYRERRERSLVPMAHRSAERALAKGTGVAISPTGARDRRIIRLALRAGGGATTRREAEGKLRRVRIVPQYPGHSRP
ncbi:MAG: hypothetical protein KIT14_02405 [bacterium]|nr:hypothetical protein [bacterium]